MSALNQIVLGLVCLLVSLIGGVTTDLEVVSDDDLLNLIRTESYVVVLFSKYEQMVITVMISAHNMKLMYTFKNKLCSQPSWLEVSKPLGSGFNSQPG